MNTVTMRAAPWYPVQKFRSTAGIYELSSETILPGKCDQLAHRWMMGLDAWCKQDPPVGIWFSELGPKNRVHTLRSYESIDKRCHINDSAMKDEEIRETVRDLAEFVIDSDVKILTPTAFSPWK
ncbi:Protein NipSnap-like [Exaiptasia diaphana]|nr:Protein NipSnap-like [Exaiptasia diaphana]